MIRFMLASAAVLTAFAGSAQAQVQAGGDVEYQAGVHYQLIQPPQPTNDAERIEVVEVFGYTCPHCANFQPDIEPWSERASDQQVDFKRMPVVFSRSWEPFARAYYTAEALGILGEAHGALFDALHTQRKRLRTDQDLASFFADFGVSEEEYLATARSFAVETRLRRATALVQRYGVTGTPSIVVNGKYLTMARMAGGYKELLDVVDHLVALESAKLQSDEEAAPAAEGASD